MSILREKKKKSCLLDQRLPPFRLNLVSFETCHCYLYGKKKWTEINVHVN